MRKIRLDKRIRYQGHGDIWPDGPPNYFQKLFSKYTDPERTRPDWLRYYFPDAEVQQELIYLRKEAVYYMLEAAKLQVRTTKGWHGWRTVTEQRVLGGRLARLRHQSADGTQIAEVESELRALRERKTITKYKVEELLDHAQYRWHTAMFTATEYLRTKKIGRASCRERV